MNNTKSINSFEECQHVGRNLLIGTRDYNNPIIDKRYFTNEGEFEKLYEKYRGLTVIRAKSGITGTPESTVLYDDPIIFRNVDFKKGKYYTISFYAKGTPGKSITCFAYPRLVSKTINGNYRNYNDALLTAPDLNKEYILTDSWKIYWATFKTLDNFVEGDIHNILFRLYSGGTEAFICGIKLEEGSVPTPWCPSLEDCEVDFIEPNLINGTSNLWSPWITPLYNRESIPMYTNIGSDSIPINIKAGEEWTAFVEIEYDNFTFASEIENNPNFTDDAHRFRFMSGGKVNEEWDVQKFQSNSPWYQLIWYLGEANETLNGIYKYTRSVKSGINVNSAQYMFRVDNLGSGRFRYRNMLVKRGNLRNPIWCKSEMDVANPNLLNSVSLYSDGTDRSDWYEKTQITDAPNPYITEGWICKPDKEINAHILNNNIMMIEEAKNRTLTFSAYIRALDDNCQIFFDISEVNNKGDSVTKVFVRDVASINVSDGWVRRHATIKNIIPANSDGRLRISVICNREHSLNPFEVCGWKLEEGDKVTAWIPYVSTANLLTNTNEGLTIKPSNIDLEEYTFESDIPQSTVKKAKSLVPIDSCYVIDVEDAPFNISKGIHVNAINKDIELNKSVFIENNNKDLTFSLYLKGTGKISMNFIPKEKEIDGVVYSSYKVGDDFEATDEWQLCSISSPLSDEFDISIVAKEGSEILLCAFKLEEGNKVSDWCDWVDPEEFNRTLEEENDLYRLLNLETNN